MRGTIGATVRTLLFVAGMGLLFTGIFTYAFPTLGAAVMPGEDIDANPDPAAPGGGPSTLPSIAAMLVGLLVCGMALGIPGRSPLPLVPEQRYTPKQRAMVVVGGLLSVAVPAVVAAFVVRSQQYYIYAIPGAVLAVVGALLVLVGTVYGLS